MVQINDYFTRKAEFNKTNHTTQEWAEWSMRKHDPKDIIFREMLTAEIEEKDVNYACAAYYCTASDLREEDIDALLFVNSGLFTYDGWDKDAQDFVIDLLMKGKVNVYDDLRNAIKCRRFNKFFTKKLTMVCSKSVDNSLGGMNSRKKEINSATSQMLDAYRELALYKKSGEDRKSCRETIKLSIQALNKAISKLEDDYTNFDNHKVYLHDKLDWKALIEKGNLSDDYLERRRPLWAYLK